MASNEEVLARIIAEMTGGMENSQKAKQIASKIANGTATYADAEAYARESSRVMTGSMRKNLPDTLTNGYMYRETAETVIRKPMKKAAGDVAKVAKEVQETLNQEAGIGLNAVVPDVNQDQITGIITGICNQPYVSGESEFFQQVENFFEGYVDDFVRENANFHYQAGLNPQIERTAVGKCCKWCDNLVGVYPYEKVMDAGNDVFRRHKNCHCQVLYNPGDGSTRRQNVHNRRWTGESNPDIIDQRSRMHLDLQQFAHKDGSYRATMYKENWQKASLRENIDRFARGAKPDKRGKGKTYYTSKDGRTSIVYDRNGNYFRIMDNMAAANKEKRPYLDLDGNRVSGPDFEKLTHFLNTDRGGK